MARLPREKEQVGRCHAAASHEADELVGVKATEVINDGLVVVDDRGPTPATELAQLDACRGASCLQEWAYGVEGGLRCSAARERRPAQCYAGGHPGRFKRDKPPQGPAEQEGMDKPVRRTALPCHPKASSRPSSG